MKRTKRPAKRMKRRNNPLPQILKRGDIITSKSGMRYKVLPRRKDETYRLVSLEGRDRQGIWMPGGVRLSGCWTIEELRKQGATMKKD